MVLFLNNLPYSMDSDDIDDLLDGDDWFFFVKNYDVKLYTNQKELPPAKVNGVPVDTTANLDNWENNFVTPTNP